MDRLIRQDLSDSDVRPGSTLRPIARLELERDGDVVAGVTLGRAEVFQRQPLEHILSRWSFSAGDRAAGTAVVSAGADAAEAGVPVYLDINDSVDDDADDRCAIAEASGFELAVERHRLAWTDIGQRLTVSDDLTFRTLAEVGHDRLAEVMASAATSTLDRNDRRNLARLNARDWAAEFIAESMQPDDERSWLVAESGAGESVGVVGVSADGDAAVLCYLCVVPERRGRRLGEQLVYAGYQAARQRRLARVYSYVDAINRPMIAALKRSGANVDWKRRLFVRV